MCLPLQEGCEALPLRHRFATAKKSLKNKRFSNRRLLHGGAPRWSTLAPFCHVRARFSIEKNRGRRRKAAGQGIIRARTRAAEYSGGSSAAAGDRAEPRFRLLRTANSSGPLAPAARREGDDGPRAGGDRDAEADEDPARREDDLRFAVEISERFGLTPRNFLNS